MTKLGRPFEIEWHKVNLLWKNKTNTQIAEYLGTSYSNVFLRRKALVAKAKDEGRPTGNYECAKPKWTRGKKQTA